MTRRRMLSLCSNGFGSLALLGLMGSKTFGNVLISGKTEPLFARRFRADAESDSTLPFGDSRP